MQHQRGKNQRGGHAALAAFLCAPANAAIAACPKQPHFGARILSASAAARDRAMWI
jgi:hypothetical protein